MPAAVSSPLLAVVHCCQLPAAVSSPLLSAVWYCQLPATVSCLPLAVAHCCQLPATGSFLLLSVARCPPSIAGLSDVSSATPTPQPVVPADVQSSIRTLNSRAKQLKQELRALRRMQLANAECMRETLHTTFITIKVRPQMASKWRIVY